MKKMWKRFWTLSKRQSGGFTLVELIVVIAILAILAGVGVPVYSGYVKKANMQADMTLISDIEHALMLAMYSDPFEKMPAGILVINKEGITLNGSPIEPASEVDNALKAAFGDGYAETLKLKYDGWTVASHLNGLDSEIAAGIQNSSYVSGQRADMLLSDVEKFTTMAHRISGIGGTTLADMFGDTLLNATAERYEIQGPAEGETWNDWHAAHPQEFANLVVLATAMDNHNYLEGKTDYEDLSAGTSCVNDFSTLYGFASTCPEFSDVLTQYMDAMNAATVTTITGADGTPVTVNPVVDATSGSQWWTKLQAEAEKAVYKNANGKTFDQYRGDEDDNAGTDLGAFMYIMSALDNTPKEAVVAGLSDSNLFTEGVVKDMFDQYLGVVEALAGTEDIGEWNLQDGEIAIIYIQDSMEVMDTIS